MRLPAGLLALLATLAAALAGAPAASSSPTAVGVSAREFSLSLYRPTVKAGTVRFNLTNFGEDGHDLAVIAPSGKQVGSTSEVRGAGGRGKVEVKLAKPGRYTLLCTLADHAGRGMKVTLRVKR